MRIVILYHVPYNVVSLDPHSGNYDGKLLKCSE